MYCTRMRRLAVKYLPNKTEVAGSVDLVAQLSQRYPRAIRGVRDALSVACVVRYSSVHTVLALSAYTGSLLAYAEGSYWLDRQRERKGIVIEEEPSDGWDPEDWFDTICRGAHIHPPLVLKHWPTEDGHAYYVLVTHDVGTDKAPITVESFAERASLLRDVAGLGCRTCSVERDPNHGGRATVYFNGIRLEDYIPPVKPLPLPPCSINGCQTQSTHHALLDVNGEHQALLCGEHMAKHDANVIDQHAALPGCSTDRWWVESDDGTASVCTDIAPELPDPEESDRKCTPDSEPLLPLHLRGIGLREGSGEGQAWPAPTGPAERAPVVRPPGAADGSKGGNIFDLLACAQGPLRRGTLAEAGPLSPTTTDKLLTAWADLGVCRKVGQLWEISSLYMDACTLPFDGREETSGE